MGAVQDGTLRRPLQKRLEVERSRYVHIANWLMFKSNYEQNMVFIQFKAECDISVSKLLGFETFPIILMVSVSVSKNFGIEKSIGIGFEKGHKYS